MTKWKHADDERPKAECYDCGMKYEEFPDMVIDDKLWEKINPTFHKSAGLLCPTCMGKRLCIIGETEVKVKFYYEIQKIKMKKLKKVWLKEDFRSVYYSASKGSELTLHEEDQLRYWKLIFDNGKDTCCTEDDIINCSTGLFGFEYEDEYRNYLYYCLIHKKMRTANTIMTLTDSSKRVGRKG